MIHIGLPEVILLKRLPEFPKGFRKLFTAIMGCLVRENQVLTACKSLTSRTALRPGILLLTLLIKGDSGVFGDLIQRQRQSQGEAHALEARPQGAHKPPQATKSSRFRGVYKRQRGGRWESSIVLDSKNCRSVIEAFLQDWAALTPRTYISNFSQFDFLGFQSLSTHSSWH